MKVMFDNITLLVTHYNRSHSLQRLLESFAQQNICFQEIVVSDDCSECKHLNKARELALTYNFKLIEANKNGGLGNNINKGQEKIITPYTLYVQEDFIPLEGYTEHLKNALAILDERPDIDLIRFYSYFKYPYLEPYKYGFSEMKFKFWYPRVRKFHMYSDHPHLRRSDFLTKFGKYAEGLCVDKTEFKMAISFLKNKGKGLYYEDYRKLFEQSNSNEEPSTTHRASFRNSSNPFISVGRTIYRNIKHHSQLLICKLANLNK